MKSCTVYRANENQQQDARKAEPLGTNTFFFVETKHTHKVTSNHHVSIFSTCW